MNDYYRKILDSNIKKGLSDAATAVKINHPFLIGKLREIILHQWLKPMLNSNYAIGNGKIIDYDGNISNEIDLCIYSKNLHPPIFFSTNEELGLFPIESVLNAIEVKSDFKLDNVKDAYGKFAKIDTEFALTAAYHDDRNQVISTYYIKPHYSLFVFDSHLKNYSPNKILKQYSKVDPKWKQDPLIANICIANKGWLCNTQQGWLHISYDKVSGINEEIIGFIATLVNDLPRIEDSRGFPQIGYYLTDPFNVDKLIDNKFVNKPCGEGKFIFLNDLEVE